MTNTKFSSDQYSNDFPYREFLESSYGEPLINWDKPTPIWKLLKQCRKTADRAEKFLNKLNSSEVSSSNRAKLVPGKATVRREYIKCGKLFCNRRHGPYYYAYWKDANGKLKKKYIGKHFQKQDKMNVSSAISTAPSAVMNAGKDADRDKLLDNNNNKILDILNNSHESKSEQKKKKDKRILSVAI